MGQVVIVGGGLAGLVAAKRLAKTGNDVTLFESRPTLGGRVASRTVDGCRLDYGFQVLFTGYPAVQAELDIEALDLKRFPPGALSCGKAGRSTVVDPRVMPSKALEMVTSGPVSLRDMLKLYQLSRQVAGRTREDIFAEADTSTVEWLYDAGFSQTFIESFARPFFGGMLLDRSLETSACVSKYLLSVLMTGETGVPSDGMQAIPDQLTTQANNAGAAIETSTHVDSIDTEEGVSVQLSDQTVTADAIVVATDPRSAASLTGIESIPTTGKAVVTQYYSHANEPLDAGGLLMLNEESGAPNHLVQQSVVAPDQAPPGRHVLSATFLEELDATDNELAERTEAALARWYPERHIDFDILATDRLEFAQYRQAPGIHATLPAVQPTEDPVFLAGEITTWSAIDGALASGQKAAEAVENVLN